MSSMSSSFVSKPDAGSARRNVAVGARLTTPLRISDIVRSNGGLGAAFVVLFGGLNLMFAHRVILRNGPERAPRLGAFA